jgi:hypothetical protein
MENVEHKRFGFSNHVFSYILFPVILIIAFVCYYRFMIKHNYIMSYEGVCDPYTESCFVGCEDDECTEEYYYSNVQKYAADLYAMCGKDITDCEAANECLLGDRNCSVTYCDPASGVVCEVFNENSKIQDELENVKEESLQDNLDKKDI